MIPIPLVAVRRVATTAPVTPDMVTEAGALINGARQADYGPPEVNFARIARRWSAVLGMAVSPAQVAECMAGLKLARLEQTPDHRDSAVDAVAYFALAEWLEAAAIRHTPADSVPIGTQADGLEND